MSAALVADDSLVTLADIQRRRRARAPDLAQAIADRDWALEHLEEAVATVEAFRGAFADLERLAQESADASFSAVHLARMIRADSAALPAILRGERG
jgi:hypothetical protein